MVDICTVEAVAIRACSWHQTMVGLGLHSKNGSSAYRETLCRASQGDLPLLLLSLVE